MMYENNDLALSGRNGGDVPFYPNAMRWAGIFRAFSLSPMTLFLKIFRLKLRHLDLCHVRSSEGN